MSTGSRTVRSRVHNIAAPPLNSWLDGILLYAIKIWRHLMYIVLPLGSNMIMEQ